MAWFKIYAICFLIFLSLDILWLGVIAKNLYQEEIGFLMAQQMRWSAAVIFYFLYIAGLVHFALIPGLKHETAVYTLLQGIFFGVVCYATYDLTNLATLKGWPLKIAIYDILWGGFISGATCFACHGIVNQWKTFFQ